MTSGQTRDLMEAIQLARQAATDLDSMRAILTAMAANLTSLVDRVTALEVRRGPGRPRKNG